MCGNGSGSGMRGSGSGTVGSGLEERSRSGCEGVAGLGSVVVVGVFAGGFVEGEGSAAVSGRKVVLSGGLAFEVGTIGRQCAPLVGVAWLETLGLGLAFWEGLGVGVVVVGVRRGGFGMWIPRTGIGGGGRGGGEGGGGGMDLERASCAM